MTTIAAQQQDRNQYRSHNIAALIRGGEFEYLIEDLVRYGPDEMPQYQRALIAAEIAARSKGNLSNRNQLPPTRIEARDWLNVSIGSMDRAKVIVRAGIRELKYQVARGMVPLATGARIARLLPEAQLEFVQKVDSGVNPRRAAPSGWQGSGNAPVEPITQREARYRFVQESALRAMHDSFDAVATVLSNTEGLDPSITPQQAKSWHRDLSRRGKAYRQIMALLKERSSQ